MKKSLKLSIPGAPQNLSLDAFKDLKNPLLDNWDLHVNDPSKRFADCWFVLEDVPEFDNMCNVPAENIVFLAAETAQPVSHIEETPHIRTFLEQFGKVFTFHQFMDERAVASTPFLPWMINSNHGESMWAEHLRNVETLSDLKSPQKTKLISVICSKQELTDNHRMRIRFVEALKQHFGDSLDWFGNGVKSVPEKWDAIAPYKYHIVLENQSRHNVITEKIGDAFLGYSYPFYWGAPNIFDFFDSRSLTILNIEDLGGSIQQIEQAIEAQFYENRINQLSTSRDIVLHQMNFLNRILSIAECLSGSVRSDIRLSSQSQVQDRIERSVLSSKWFYKAVSEIDRIFLTNILALSKEVYILLRYNRLTLFFRSKLWPKN